MSSYACVYLSDGRPICTFRDGVDQLFFILFTTEDWIELNGEDAWPFVKDHYGAGEQDARVLGFRTTAGVLRDRLDLCGVPLSAVASELLHLAAEHLETTTRLHAGRAVPTDMSEEMKEEIAYLADLSWDRWLDDLNAGLAAGLPVSRWGGREAVGSPGWLMSLWDYHDARFVLRAVLEALPPDEEITLDLDDLLEGGWLEPPVNPRDHANGLVAYASQGGLPPIVLTEGRFDVEVLSAALRIRRPHLVEYVRFPDFNQKNEGGAAALRQTIRAFASAGIPNRVVAVFDNDTAARDVLHALDASALPANLVVTHLPDLDLAVDYPTVGPQGENSMDVNGLAGSIEMYLGVDVLTETGALQPVIWGGYVQRLKAYQGEVSGRDAIHDRFRSKVAAAIGDPDVTASQDWAALDLVLDHILGLLTEAVTEQTPAG